MGGHLQVSLVGSDTDRNTAVPGGKIGVRLFPFPCHQNLVLMTCT